MRLIEDIRNRGYKGFDKLPHYDLTPSMKALFNLNDKTTEAYARPLHDCFTVGIKPGQFEVVTFIQKSDAVDMAYLSETMTDFDDFQAFYRCFLLAKAKKKWGVLPVGLTLCFDSSWVCQGVTSNCDSENLTDFGKCIKQDFTFIHGAIICGPEVTTWIANSVNCYLRTFFALCHTQGVETITHTPTPKQIRGVRKKNLKIPRSFKTLKLNDTLKVSSSRSEGSGNSLEQPHFRRGHLNTAKHPRYRVKNWWTESHIVGKELPGKLLTDTKVIE